MNEYRIVCEVLIYNLFVNGLNDLFGKKIEERVLDETRYNEANSVTFENLESDLVCCLYKKIGDNKNYYEVIKIEKNINDIRDIPITSDEKIEFSEYMYQKYYKEIIDEINFLEQFIHLMTNVHIFFPKFIFNVYNGEKRIDSFGEIRYCPIRFRQHLATEENIDICKRLSRGIGIETFKNLLEKDEQYKKAFDLFNESFKSTRNETKYILLVSALECIFNMGSSKGATKKFIDGVEILLLDNKMSRTKIKKIYEMRSNFIHHNEVIITDEDELKLREIVRTALLNYYFICIVEKIEDNADLNKILENIRAGKIDINKYSISKLII